MLLNDVPAGKQITIAGPAQVYAISGNAPSYTYTSAAPALDTLAPNTAVHGGAPLTVTATGTGFLPTSKVYVDGAAVPTVYVSVTSLKFTLTPAAAAKTSKVEVRQAGDRVTAQVDFTIT